MNNVFDTFFLMIFDHSVKISVVKIRSKHVPVGHIWKFDLDFGEKSNF